MTMYAVSPPDPLTVLVTGSLGPSDEHRIRAAAPDADVRFVPRVVDAATLLPTVHVLAGALRPDELAAAARLRWVHSWAAGVDGMLFPELIAHPVVLTSSKGNGAVPLAEHALLLMLMLSRDAPRWAAAQEQRAWDRYRHGELAGSTCGILGLGNVGSALATRAGALGMRVIGLRRSAAPVAGVERVYSPSELVEFMAASDFVVVTAALTPQTRGMIGTAELRAMRPSAFCVCVSRGGIIDDTALLTALHEGWIAGAGLDAHTVEPLPPDSPFWSAPNTIITPHNGATTEATQRRGVDIFVDNLGRLRRGLPLRNVVDKSAGY
jgi:phosphoglycerate dehydrogenase-like enzyme